VRLWCHGVGGSDDAPPGATTRSLEGLLPSYSLIHRSAWKWKCANFALRSSPKSACRIVHSTGPLPPSAARESLGAPKPTCPARRRERRHLGKCTRPCPL
jgi:hypothetical protein